MAMKICTVRIQVRGTPKTRVSGPAGPPDSSPALAINEDERKEIDGLVRSRLRDGQVKNSICKAPHRMV
jgi:hypothetical protein